MSFEIFDVVEKIPKSDKIRYRQNYVRTQFKLFNSNLKSKKKLRIIVGSIGQNIEDSYAIKIIGGPIL